MKQIDPAALADIAGGANIAGADSGGMQVQRTPDEPNPPKPPPPPWWLFVPEPLPWPFDRL